MMTKRAAVQPKMQFITIEDLMPKEHFLRDVYNAISFDFIYDKVAHLYSAVGRPSIDPVIITKIFLIGYFYDIFSERRLMDEIQVNIAYRWFIGIDLDEPVPNHSTLSQLRRRKFNDSRIFEDIFDEIVEKCIEIGLVTGKILLTDSTHIRANAANDKSETVVVQQEPSDYMRKLDEAALADGLIKELGEPKFVEKEVTKSVTDPDCGMLGRPGKPSGFHYLNHQTIDGDSGIITDVHITPANAADHSQHAPRVNYQIDKFGFDTKAVGGDAGYDEPEIHAEMLRRNIKTYIPLKARGVKENYHETYTKRDFVYDVEKDIYICPNGCLLKFSTFKKGRGVKRYTAKAVDCRNCSLKGNCLSGKTKTKQLERSYHWTQYEKQHENDTTPQYLEVQRLRKIWCEGTFSHQKARHSMTRAKMRGIVQTKGQCLLSACVVNLKRMIKWLKGRLEVPQNSKKPLNFRCLLIRRLFLCSFVNSSLYMSPPAFAGKCNEIIHTVY
jgi:transposase